MSLLIRTRDSCLVYFLRNPFCVLKSQFSSTTNQSFFTVNYLMYSCGLSADKALAASKKCTLKRSVNADSVLALLTNHGFSKTQIRELITRDPDILLRRVENNLQPKIQFLVDFGLSATQFGELIVSKPYILKLGLRNKLVPTFNFLKELLHTNEKVIRAIRSCPWFIDHNFEKNVIPNISFLQKQRIPICHISRFFMHEPRRFMVKVDRFSEVVTKVKELGFDSCSPSMFIEAISAVALSQSTWEAKSMVYRSFGWSEKDVLSAFRKRPKCMLMSEEKIGRFMDFFLNKLGLKPSHISYRPNLLFYSLEQRIIPRCTVLQILASNSLIGKDLTLRQLQQIIQMGERQFLEIYVIKHQNEAPEVLKAYQGQISFSKLDIKA